MKSSGKLLESAFSQGYIFLPREFVRLLLRSVPCTSSSEEALFFAHLLLGVNYKDCPYRVGNREFICARGESYRSLEEWARCMNCSKGHVRTLIKKLIAKGYIERLSEEGCHRVTRLRVIEYDCWTGRALKKDKPDNSQTPEEVDRLFEEFWEHYHSVTRMDKVNKYEARKGWVRLTPEERSLAIGRASVYYGHLRNTRFCRQASGYISGKCFLNEYEEEFGEDLLDFS
ncbi:hypothetical protein [Bacteroides sp. 224]|uniref:hypothetical protein n=1 Tax=Bacteroides sp. 224 TaxID=2302936 RepID=UPI0013D5D056|nr:hypothetical protein [Bacteroides sp. 224]NDV66630.1 hypothetical protein [Bacteroides sp. 224]